MDDEELGSLTPLRRAGPLSARERWLVVAAAAIPIVVALVVLAVIGRSTGAGSGEIVVSALVYGGLVGLAGAVVATDRLQARQCPRCRARPGRGAARCTTCAYDLEERPRFACEQRHQVFLDADGTCPCGRPLERLGTPQGIGRQVTAMLRIGAWMLAFLLGMGALLRFLEG